MRWPLITFFQCICVIGAERRDIGGALFHIMNKIDFQNYVALLYNTG